MKQESRFSLRKPENRGEWIFMLCGNLLHHVIKKLKLSVENTGSIHTDYQANNNKRNNLHGKNETKDRIDLVEMFFKYADQAGNKGYEGENY